MPSPLAQCRVGRVVITDRALPAAFPVNFALLDEDVVFLTTQGSKLEAAEGEEVMAFEADEIDAVLHTGLERAGAGPGQRDLRSRGPGAGPGPPARTVGAGHPLPVRAHPGRAGVGRRLLPKTVAGAGAVAPVSRVELLDFAAAPRAAAGSCCR